MMDHEEDAIRHMLREHRDTLRSLLRTSNFQARNTLQAPAESCHRPTLLPVGTEGEEEEEEVPLLPPPLYWPLLPEETPPLLPPGSPPPLSSETP